MDSLQLTLGDWYHHLFVKRQPILTKMFNKRLQKMNCYYSFLMPSQIRGKVYEQLGIPCDCGKPNRVLLRRAYENERKYKALAIRRKKVRFVQDGLESFKWPKTSTQHSMNSLENRSKSSPFTFQSQHVRSDANVPHLHSSVVPRSRVINVDSDLSSTGFDNGPISPFSTHESPSEINRCRRIPSPAVQPSEPTNDMVASPGSSCVLCIPSDRSQSSDNDYDTGLLSPPSQRTQSQNQALVAVRHQTRKVLHETPAAPLLSLEGSRRPQSVEELELGQAQKHLLTPKINQNGENSGKKATIVQRSKDQVQTFSQSTPIPPLSHSSQRSPFPENHSRPKTVEGLENGRAQKRSFWREIPPKVHRNEGGSKKKSNSQSTPSRMSLLTVRRNHSEEEPKNRVKEWLHTIDENEPSPYPVMMSQNEGSRPKKAFGVRRQNKWPETNERPQDIQSCSGVLGQNVQDWLHRTEPGEMENRPEMSLAVSRDENRPSFFNSGILANSSRATSVRSAMSPPTTFVWEVAMDAQEKTREQLLDQALKLIRANALDFFPKNEKLTRLSSYERPRSSTSQIDVCMKDPGIGDKSEAAAHATTRTENDLIYISDDSSVEILSNVIVEIPSPVNIFTHNSEKRRPSERSEQTTLKSRPGEDLTNIFEPEVSIFMEDPDVPKSPSPRPFGSPSPVNVISPNYGSNSLVINSGFEADTADIVFKSNVSWSMEEPFVASTPSPLPLVLDPPPKSDVDDNEHIERPTSVALNSESRSDVFLESNKSVLFEETTLTAESIKVETDSDSDISNFEDEVDEILFKSPDSTPREEPAVAKQAEIPTEPHLTDPTYFPADRKDEYSIWLQKNSEEIASALGPTSSGNQKCSPTGRSGVLDNLHSSSSDSFTSLQDAEGPAELQINTEPPKLLASATWRCAVAWVTRDYFDDNPISTLSTRRAVITRRSN